MRIIQWIVPLALLALAFPVQASEFGRDGFSGNPDTNNGANCTACHQPGAANPDVTITGPGTLESGQTGRYSITITGGPGVTAGAGISTENNAGALTSINSELQAISDELSHTQPAAFNGNSKTFEFEWTAPAYSDDITLYAAGNSSNGQLNLLGDGIGTDTLRVTITGGGPPPPPPPPPDSSISLTTFATGLNRPVNLAHAGDERLFVVEQAGRIQILDASGSVLSEPFLNIEPAVDDGGNEQGLLGLAFHPGYAANGNFYVYYTYDPPGSGDDRSRISRFTVSSGNPDQANAGSELIMMEFDQPFRNHNAGDMHFGADGYLYIASGDGGSGGDPRDLAQNPDVLLGKLLRIDVDGGSSSVPDCDLTGGSNYTIPAGNTYNDGTGGAGCDEIWATGLRNPWRFTFDRLTDDLWMGDVGQNAFEEINFVSSDSGAGLNFGWRCYEGNAQFNLDDCGGSVYTFPVHVMPHSEGDCSVTGGRVYRGFQQPALFGQYFFSDFCNSAIRTLTGPTQNFAETTVLPAGTIAGIATFGENAAGEMFTVDLGAGIVYRIESDVSGPVIGESGSVSVNQNGRTEWYSVNFDNNYITPVVVMGPPSRRGGDELTVRVRNVTGTGFEFQMDEWPPGNDVHIRENIGWLVVEAGDHVLEDGTRLQAGTTTTNHNWSAVDFPTSFAQTPVVLAQISSRRGAQEITERLRRIGESGFQVRVQEAEVYDGRHAVEFIDWLAIEPGFGSRHEAADTGNVVNQGGFETDLERGFLELPVVLADIQSYRGADTTALRLQNANEISARFRLEEEQSADTEQTHVRENVGYLGILTGEIRARPAD